MKRLLKSTLSLWLLLTGIVLVGRVIRFQVNGTRPIVSEDVLLAIVIMLPLSFSLMLLFRAQIRGTLRWQSKKARSRLEFLRSLGFAWESSCYLGRWRQYDVILWENTSSKGHRMVCVTVTAAILAESIAALPGATVVRLPNGLSEVTILLRRRDFASSQMARAHLDRLISVIEQLPQRMSSTTR